MFREALRRQRQEEAKRKREDDVPVATEPVVDGEPDPKRQETEADAEVPSHMEQDQQKLPESRKHISTWAASKDISWPFEVKSEFHLYANPTQFCYSDFF